MSRRMAFLHLPPIRWLTSFYNPPATKYHYYDDLDIENLARILKYREFKFPLQQIKKL